MKAAWLSVGGLVGLVSLVGCGASGGTGDKPANTAGSSSGGSASGGTTGTTAGMSGGGSQSQSGSSTGGGGTGTAGSGTGGGGSGGGSGGGGGTSAKGFACPAGASEAPKLTGLTPTRVMGVPPADAFNNMNNDFSNIEGDVWVGDALYVSEISATLGKQGEPPPGRVLKITADDKVSILLPDSGSNGLAVNAAGELFGAIHKDGSISKLSLSGGAATPVASMFMGKRFDSPNDLTIHPNGTIYFTDPSWQAPNPAPQTATRAYRVPPGGQPEAIEPNVNLDQPNGITLSKNLDFLYIAGNQLKKYPVMADGSLGAGVNFPPNGGGKGDGMVIDCGDNLYVATGQNVTVYSPAGQVLGTFTVPGLGEITNVAFGGTDHKTLYVSGQGGKDSKGLFKIPMNVAGYPY
ncbi:MAG TPA: SMP-30/gluconolactonase/LRE family protein [Polyangiaceae bacterium]|nr:SMP-30/gluconolactonase/LRE family protein [Polyangiaceae bacterium]